jgi:hypothetical protein
MASKKITDLPLLDETPASGDFLIVEDVSAGATKRVPYNRIPSAAGSAFVLMWGARDLDHTNITTWLWPGFAQAEDGSIEVEIEIPFACTLSKLRARVKVVSGGSGESTSVTVRKNGVSTTVTCSIGHAGTNASDTTHSVACVAGDRVSMQVDYAGSFSGDPQVLTVTLEGTAS